MTKEDVIRIAREFGWEEKNWASQTVFIVDMGDLVNFAFQVAAAEREACAKAAEGFPENRDWVPNSLWGNIRRDVANFIRKRSGT
ncbi:hypothetical protein CCO03_17160 [Comamonas serinivorans]|uniref:Uncharacterized protein n=1 Tax=Comamonas serinivorans TaxID=1082851 RepID=A0A1Y0ESF0_9BURK|nr:hypothetical protein [Comamonas serinivorans]ARU04698.1 hypothetical protein CCO03_08440 [Comamonas serinivorans]ARU06172.1 hypothetical protein CCO03_17160 [Comamonas serinivorans]